jgi:hypothetical protein
VTDGSIIKRLTGQNQVIVKKTIFCFSSAICRAKLSAGRRSRHGD